MDEKDRTPGYEGEGSAARVAASEWRGPVERRLVDAVTGEPVPHFSLGFTHGVPSDATPITTDAEGRFRTTGAYAAGELEVLLIDSFLPGGKTTKLQALLELAARESR